MVGMSDGGAERRKPATVAIVSNAPDTALEPNLFRNSINARRIQVLDAVLEAIGAHSRAVVLFADEFPLPAVCDLFDVLRARYPRLLIIVVTRSPKPFVRARISTERPAVIVPNPAWAWRVIEALHSGAAGRTTKEGIRRT